MCRISRAVYVISVFMAFVYAISFSFALKDTCVDHWPNNRGRGDIAYYYSAAPCINNMAHVLFWPLTGLLELTGRWVFDPYVSQDVECKDETSDNIDKTSEKMASGQARTNVAESEQVQEVFYTSTDQITRCGG